MGSCLGHCHTSRESFSLYKFYSKANDTVQINKFGKCESEEHIITDLPSLQDKGEQLNNPQFEICSRGITCFCFGRLKSVFSNAKNPYVERSALRLELLDDEWSYSEGEDLVRRNEGNLAPLSSKNEETKEFTSASVNSLDLEWEHLPEMMVFSNNNPNDREEPKSVTSAEAWSRVSDSADSLEWDLAEVEMKEEIDTETEQLLHEIEMLSSKTLQETHEWAS